MGLRRRIKNKIKSIFFGQEDEERKNPRGYSSDIMYETVSSPIQSNEENILFSYSAAKRDNCTATKPNKGS